ncbi:MAG: PAS domain S-box protein [Anaerolineales bacterium]|nr:PAS domain S-box protein [Anaerolineales bacterium]
MELANQRLREQEARFHALADHAGDAIFVVDRDGIIVYANERAATLTGLDDRRLRRQPFAGIAPPEVQPVLAGRLQQCLTGGPVPNPFETSLLQERLPFRSN